MNLFRTCVLLVYSSGCALLAGMDAPPPRPEAEPVAAPVGLPQQAPIGCSGRVQAWLMEPSMHGVVTCCGSCQCCERTLEALFGYHENSCTADTVCHHQCDECCRYDEEHCCDSSQYCMHYTMGLVAESCCEHACRPIRGRDGFRCWCVTSAKVLCCPLTCPCTATWWLGECVLRGGGCIEDFPDWAPLEQSFYGRSNG